MKAIVKVLIPAALALGAISAHAADNQTWGADFHPVSTLSRDAVRAQIGQPSQYVIHNNEIGFEPNDSAIASTRSRDEVRREAAQPRRFDVAYFA